MKVFISPFNKIKFYIIVTFIIFFLASSLRHNLYNSNAYDLGIFDNGIYLISQGKNPYVSFRELHILGDHAAWILYLIAPLYVILPTVYWLFIIQSFALAIAILPIWHLGKLMGLTDSKTKTVCLIYILYPLIFNVNLFDFHPEVIAVPLFFSAILAVRSNNFFGFIISIFFILGCKAVLALNIMMMGIWLIIFNHQKRYGMIAIFSGLFWFIIATQLLIPIFSGEEAAAVSRYGFLGNSVAEIILNLVLKPQIILSYLLTGANLEYLLLLFIPVIPALAWQELTNLIPAIPAIFLNLLTDYQPQKDLIHQYSLPIIPFLILTVISSLANQKTWLSSSIKLRIWSLITFLILAKYVYFFPNSLYLKNLFTWQSTNEAINLIDKKASVLTASQIVPHLSHREIIYLATDDFRNEKIDDIDYILLNLAHPGFGSSKEKIKELIELLKFNNNFKLIHEKDNIFLFNKQNQ
ncbi:DUF2079 domain-containing protein [Geminocystis sp. GBBB08]|uniref:DUF2079 domain-containing protein n=1 Tax=Geminocystis sp. GBBB08 TaxID=2604140 RepID=UPI0027E2AAB2|nr:DUF2079 domain-containing protein [Geminocystis sp. GBBB08]MBL1209046.1 DUF2079 domain-containing protein [Geminocystis sp. GBBB08]